MTEASQPGGSPHNQRTGKVGLPGQGESPAGSRASHSAFRRIRTRSGPVALASFTVLATTLFAASFFVAVPSASVVASGHLGPISTSPEHWRNAGISPIPPRRDPESYTVSFRFEAFSLARNDQIFEIGSGKSALRALVDPGVGNGRALILTTGLANRSTLTAVLLDHVALSRSYSVDIVVENGEVLTARVDGRLQFQYSYPSREFANRLSPVVIGDGSNAPAAFPGEVRAFTLSYRVFGTTEHGLGRSVLRLASGLAVAVAIALLLLLLATGTLMIRAPALAAERSASRTRRHSFVNRHQAIIATALVTGGVIAIALLTPPENNDAQRSDYQRITSVPIPKGTWVGTDYGKAPPLIQPTSVVDVHLSFEMRVAALPIPGRHFSSVVVAAARGDQGVQINLTRQGELYGIIGLRYSSSALVEYLSHRVPVGKWVEVSVYIERNQSFQLRLDGQLESAFTFADPALNALPSGLSAGGGPSGTFGGTIKNLAMTVSIYDSKSEPPDHDVRRGFQFLGFLAVTLGVIMLCRRWLARFIPVATSAKRELVLVVFGTAGTLEAIDLAVSLLHFQPNVGPGIARNTWLFAPYARFSDFLQAFAYLKYLNPYGMQGGSYPPVGYWLVAPVAWMSNFGGLFVYLASFIGFMAWWVWRSFASALKTIEGIVVLCIAFISLPVSFSLDRGNVDIWVFIFLVFGITALEQRRQVLAASWIGLVAAAKLVPVIYLFGFLRRQRWRYILLGLVVAAVTTLAGFASFQGSFIGNIHGFRSAVSDLEMQYNYQSTSTFYNTSIYGWAQAIGYAVGGLHGSLVVRVAIAPYVLPIEIVSALALGWYLRCREPSLWRAVTLMTMWVLLMQDVSYYYQLLFVFVPLALFVKHAPVNPRILRIACLFGLILAPKTYFFIGNSAVDNSVLLTAPLLVALTLSVIRDGELERRLRITTEALDLPAPSHRETVQS